MTDSLGRRLTAAFAGIALVSALLTIVMVNFAFGGRFDTYLEQQGSARERQLATAFISAYERPQGWEVKRLDQLAPLVAMTSAEVRLVDPSGDSVWSWANAQMGPEMAQRDRPELDTTGTGVGQGPRAAAKRAR